MLTSELAASARALSPKHPLVVAIVTVGVREMLNCNDPVMVPRVSCRDSQDDKVAINGIPLKTNEAGSSEDKLSVPSSDTSPATINSTSAPKTTDFSVPVTIAPD